MNETEKSEITFEQAREAHERWLIKNNRNDLETAIKYYSKTLKTNPNIAESYYRLAMLLWESGQISLTTALNKCKSALVLYPNSVSARLYFGYFLKLAGKYEEAENEFKKAVHLSPIVSSRARLNLGLFYSEQLLSGKIKFHHILECGYYLFTGLCAGFLDYPFIKMSIEKVKEKFCINKYLITGRILKFCGLSKKAEKTYKKAVLKTGHFEIFNNLIGDLNVEKEDIDSALKSYKQILKIHPFNREALLKTATILQTYYEDRYEEAIEAYTKALQTEGDKAYIYYELGHLYLRKNDFINAVNAFKLAVKSDEMNAFFHNALGFAYFRAGLFEEAEDHYIIAINLNPEPEWTATVCRALAVIYSDIRKKPEKAIAMYMQSLSLMPDCAETYYSLGDLYFEEEDYNKAVDYYSKSLSINPNDAYVCNKFATALFKKGFIEDAIIAYKNAIDADCTYAPAFNNLGAVYLENKNMLSEAKDCFEEAISIDKNYIAAHFNAARTYESLGDKISAAKLYSKALFLNKDKNELSNNDIEERIHALFNT